MKSQIILQPTCVVFVSPTRVSIEPFPDVSQWYASIPMETLDGRELGIPAADEHSPRVFPFLLSDDVSSED